MPADQYQKGYPPSPGCTAAGLQFTGANLSNANLSGSTFSSVGTVWSLGSQKSNDSGAIFTSATLTGANLSKAALYKANFSKANLSQVNLSGANLTGANLTDADFAGATWTDGVTICTSGNLGKCTKPFVSSADLDKVLSWISASVVSAKTPFCYLNSWGRGVGVPVSSCPDNKSKDGGLCYDKCRDGYSDDGATMCYQNCSDGWSGTLTSCTKPHYYDRGAGILPEIDNCGKGNCKCDHKTCKSNRQLEDVCVMKFQEMDLNVP